MKALNAKLVNIQSQLKAPKNQRNSFGGYNYRSAEDILESVKPLLKQEDLTLTMNDEIVSVADRIYVKATATLSDGEDSIQTSAFAREPLSKKGSDEAQITGATSSYARKYALNGLFCIDDTKDPDYTNTHGKEEKVSKTSNPLAPAHPTDKKPLVQEGNDLWTKAIAYCRRKKCGAIELRKWYEISDADIKTMDGILELSSEINKETQEFLDLDESAQNPKNRK